MTATNTAGCNKVIWTSKCIAAHLGVSQAKFYNLVKAGLPAVVIDGTWCAHADNLDAFFRQRTAKIMTTIPSDAD